MSVSSNVSVKAYLDKKGLTNGEVQIRRFDLDQEVSSSYEYLRSKLAAIFPDLVEHGFRVYWKGKGCLNYMAKSPIIFTLRYVVYETKI